MSLFNVDGVNLYYEDRGRKDSENCIVFFNGAMSATQSWELVYPIFEKLGWRVVLHDFKGQLKSDKPQGPYSFQEHAAEAKALFDHLQLGPVHVVGTSYGGRAAMEFAVLYPEMVKTLGLVNTFSESNAYIDTIVKSWETSRVAGNGESYFWHAAPIFYGKTFIANHGAEIEARAKKLGEADAQFFAGSKAIYDTFTKDIYMTDRLPQIQAPALIICGEEDILTTVKFSEILAAGIPQTEFMVIPDCGHVTIAEKPAELTSALLGFVLKHTL